MIESFKHKGLEALFRRGETRGLQAQQVPRILRILDALDAAAEVQTLDVPGWHLHRLKGNLKGLWSLKVSGNWRITFEFENGNATVLNLEDYH